MKNFNINRFWQVLKWTVLTEKKNILTACIAFTVAFLAIQLFSCFTIFDINQSLGQVATVGAMATCLGIMGFASSYYTSGVLGNARTSRQRTMALMLPASNLEKFVARLVYCCIVMLVVLYVAATAATFLRMFLEWIAGHDDITAGFSVLFGSGFDIEGNVTYNIASEEVCEPVLFNIALKLWFASLFVLGGTFFRKRPFVWTFVSLFVASMVLFTIIFYVCTLIGEMNLKNILEPIFKDMTPETFLNWVGVFLLAFSALNVWISYRLFCRLQVVQHKWFNV